MNYSQTRDDKDDFDTESLRYKKLHQRSNSIAADKETKNMLRLTGRNTI